MKYYATLFYMNEMGIHVFKRDEMIDATLQSSISDTMIWGHGKTREESIRDAV